MQAVELAAAAPGEPEVGAGALPGVLQAAEPAQAEAEIAAWAADPAYAGASYPWTGGGRHHSYAGLVSVGNPRV